MRGQGRVFRRGDRLWIAYYQHGREHRESTGGLDAAVARALLNARLGQVATGALLAPELARLTVADALALKRADLESRPLRSRRLYCAMLDRIGQALGQVRLQACTAETIATWEQGLRARGRAHGTRVNYVVLLRGAFALAIKRRWLPVVPDFPRLGPVRNARQGFVEAERLDRLLPALPDLGRELVRFAYASGWRETEILGLTWDMVDRHGREIRLPTSKTHTPRTLAIEGDLVALMTRRWAARVHGDRLVAAVFHRKGRTPTAATLRRWWDRARRAIGQPELYLHDLRRSAARNMIRAGVPETVAMSITGHRSRAMFRRYHIVTTDDQRAALRATQAFVAARRRKGGQKADSHAG